MVHHKIATRKTSNRFKSFLLILYYLLESIILYLIPMSFKKRKNVKNKIVLITGGGSGLGQLMALEFLKLGSKVIIWDVFTEGMKLTKRIAEEKNLNVENLYTYQVDLADTNAIYETWKKVKNEIGIVTILINNAGVVSGRNFLDIPDEKILLTFKVNCLSHFYMIKAFLPDMIKQNGGHIVTVASVAGNIGVCSLSDYCASKHANVGMDFSLRMELAKANLEHIIKTTIIKPYFITTGMFSGVDPGLFTFLKPTYVVEKIIEAILTETVQVVLPWYQDWLLSFLPWIPHKCFIPLTDFLGGFDFMTNFHGRQMSPLKEVEINNNSFKNNDNNRR